MEEHHQAPLSASREHPVVKNKPLKVLATSLGAVLAANLLLVPAVNAQAGAEPKLVEWSTEEVKKFFDPQTDWNIPLPGQETNAPEPSESPNGSGDSSGSGGGTTVVHHYGGGFGWTDLMLYHMIFNSGRPYSSSGWHDRYPSYDPRTNQPYRPRTYSSGSFENRPVVGSNVKPKTSSGSGSFSSKSGSSSSSSKSTSSSRGSMGSKSGGFSSSGS